MNSFTKPEDEPSMQRLKINSDFNLFEVEIGYFSILSLLMEKLSPHDYGKPQQCDQNMFDQYYEIMWSPNFESLFNSIKLQIHNAVLWHLSNLNVYPQQNTVPIFQLTFPASENNLHACKH